MSVRIKRLETEMLNTARLVKRLLASLATALLLIALTDSGRPQSNGSAAELPRLFQIGLPPADVAFLLDASLSMRSHRYGEVRQAVVDFTSTLTDKETLHLRVFGDIAGASLEDRADKVSGNVAEHLPVEPLFQYTDLGLAILKGLEFLERNGASEAQALFLITDGMHQPPPGSHFTRDFANDPNWQALRERAQRLCQKRQVMVYGFGLGRQTDVTLLSQVFPTTNVELIAGDAAQVATALRRVRENLQQARLRRAVEQELSSGRVEVKLARNEIHGDAKGFAEPVTIRNGYHHLPVVIERVLLGRSAASSKEIVCELEDAPRGPHELTLAPGQQWQGRIKGILQADLPGLSVGRNERVYRTEIQIGPVARFKHEAEIAQTGVDQTKVFRDEPSLRIELRASYGVPHWSIAGVLLTCLGIVLAIRRRSKLAAKHIATVEQRHAERRRIAGEIKIWPSDKTEPDEGGLDLGVHKSERLCLATRSDGGLEIVATADREADVVATLSGNLSGVKPDKAESGRVEFRLEAARGYRLACESGGEWREAARVTLCDRDLIVIGGRWNLRYANHRLRSRAEVESARSE